MLPSHATGHGRLAHGTLLSSDPGLEVPPDPTPNGHPIRARYLHDLHG